MRRGRAIGPMSQSHQRFEFIVQRVETEGARGLIKIAKAPAAYADVEAAAWVRAPRRPLNAAIPASILHGSLRHGFALFFRYRGLSLRLRRLCRRRQSCNRKIDRVFIIVRDDDSKSILTSDQSFRDQGVAALLHILRPAFALSRRATILQDPFVSDFALDLFSCAAASRLAHIKVVGLGIHGFS